MKPQTSYLFVTLEGGGNIPPVLGLARCLSVNGHRVRVLTEPCLEEAVRSHGLEYVPFRKYFTRTDRREDIFHDWKATLFSNPTFDNVLFGPAKDVVEETVRVMQEAPVDVLVADCLLTPALIAAEFLQVPGVLIFHMPEYMPGPNRPPGMMGLLPGKGFFGKIRDRILGGVFHRLLNRYLLPVNQIRQTYGLPALSRMTELIDHADRRFIQTLSSFDFPIEPALKNVRYTGPVLDDPDWTESWENPWGEKDSRPLVVVSLSSTFQNQASVIRHCIEALKGLEVRGLLTLGLAMDGEHFEVPEHVKIVRSAPHSQVFPLADMVVTHGGHGTVMRALAHGLPLVCLPMGRDQKDNAAKVVFQGCGISLKPQAGSQKIRQAIGHVLSAPQFRQNAMRLQEEIRMGAVQETAVAELEQLGRRGKKALASPV